MEAIKPGIRCECRNGDCSNANSGGHLDQCLDDAVRMVTVPWGTQWTDNKFANIPMCAACADHAERSCGDLED